MAKKYRQWQGIVRFKLLPVTLTADAPANPLNPSVTALTVGAILTGALAILGWSPLAARFLASWRLDTAPTLVKLFPPFLSCDENVRNNKEIMLTYIS